MKGQNSHQTESQPSLMGMVDRYASLRNWNSNLLVAFVFVLGWVLVGWAAAFILDMDASTEGIEWFVIPTLLVIPLFFLWRSVNRQFVQTKQLLEQRELADKDRDGNLEQA